MKGVAWWGWVAIGGTLVFTAAAALLIHLVGAQSKARRDGQCQGHLAVAQSVLRSTRTARTASELEPAGDALNRAEAACPERTVEVAELRKQLRERSDAAAPAPAPNKLAHDPRIAKAQGVWARFDRLTGEQFRTREMLVAHRLQAEQGLEFLPEAEAKIVREYNARQFRQRLPTVIVPGEVGRAEGNDLTIIVPSEDGARCTKLASAWRKAPQADQLLGYGFKSVRCGSETWDLSTQ